MVFVERDVFKSVIVEDGNGGELRIDEGMRIKFCTEEGEVIKGDLVKISGKGDKTKLQIVPYDTQKQEIWEMSVMVEGSLTIDED